MASVTSNKLSEGTELKSQVGFLKSGLLAEVKVLTIKALFLLLCFCSFLFRSCWLRIAFLFLRESRSFLIFRDCKPTPLPGGREPTVEALMLYMELKLSPSEFLPEKEGLILFLELMLQSATFSSIGIKFDVVPRYRVPRGSGTYRNAWHKRETSLDWEAEQKIKIHRRPKLLSVESYFLLSKRCPWHFFPKNWSLPWSIQTISWGKLYDEMHRFQESRKKRNSFLQTLQKFIQRYMRKPTLSSFQNISVLSKKKKNLISCKVLKSFFSGRFLLNRKSLCLHVNWDKRKGM